MRSPALDSGKKKVMDPTDVKEPEAIKLQPVSVEVPEENATTGSLGVAPVDPAEARAAQGQQLPATVRPLEEGGGGGAGEAEGDVSVSQVQLEVGTPHIIADGEPGNVS